MRLLQTIVLQLLQQSDGHTQPLRTLLTHLELPMASIRQMMAKSMKTQKISLSRLRSREERLPCTPVAFIMICRCTGHTVGLQLAGLQRCINSVMEAQLAFVW